MNHFRFYFIDITELLASVMLVTEKDELFMCFREFESVFAEIHEDWISAWWLNLIRFIF